MHTTSYARHFLVEHFSAFSMASSGDCYSSFHNILNPSITVLGQKKKDNSFWSHQNSKLTLWRWVFFSRQNLMIAIHNIFVRPHTTQNETNIVDAPISDSASKTASCLNDWSNNGNQILHQRPYVSSTVCPVRMQFTWCYNYMVVLLHGAIRFFVISCSANIYNPFFLNWRI